MLLACNQDNPSSKHQQETQKFNPEKWAVKDKGDYPYRDIMLDDLRSSYKLKFISRDSILQLLGVPDKEVEAYLYYRISQRRLGAWPLHTKTLVIKCLGEGAGNEIYIHE